MPSIAGVDNENLRTARVVIVGGGFGGAYCAQALERQRRRGAPIEPRLIDRNNYFVFYPLLAEAGTGNLEPRHVIVPIRSFLKSDAFVMGEVNAIDFERSRVSFRRPISGRDAELRFDHLVLAPGSVTRLPDVPGLREHGFELKSLTDAVVLRDRAVALLEAADAEENPQLKRSLLHFVVVGANFTGVEVAGEYDMLLRRATRHYRNLRPRDCRVTLVEIADRILPALDADLASYAQRHLQDRGLHVRLRSSVREVREREVLLDDGETLAASTVIWCAGIAPSPLLRRLGLPTDERGYIACDPDLRVSGTRNVWAIGDSAANPDPSGKPYPATAQHAVRQGEHLAKNIARVISGRAPTPFVFDSLGSLVALGCRSAVARILGVKLSGFAAWFLFRSVYLMKMPGLARKARVALDWTIDLFGSPDVVQLGVHRARRDAPPSAPPGGES